ncbi:hypothetical protein STEG23_005881, partial [Scotinomys teguina]
IASPTTHVAKDDLEFSVFLPPPPSAGIAELMASEPEPSSSAINLGSADHLSDQINAKDKRPIMYDRLSCEAGNSEGLSYLLAKFGNHLFCILLVEFGQYTISKADSPVPQTAESALVYYPDTQRLLTILALHPPKSDVYTCTVAHV